MATVVYVTNKQYEAAKDVIRSGIEAGRKGTDTDHTPSGVLAVALMELGIIMNPTLDNLDNF